MRRGSTANQHHCSACYGAGTRVEVHRSRYELERVLHKHGAHDVLFVEADANASIQFAMRGHYVQLALPLPDPEEARFTHTASGRRRSAAAQERAYEQEFERFLAPRFSEERKRKRRAPKAVNWLLGGSHTVAIGLVAAFLVPASAVGAFALPANVVGHLATPFRSSVPDDPTASGPRSDGAAVALGGWTPSRGGTYASD